MKKGMSLTHYFLTLRCPQVLFWLLCVTVRCWSNMVHCNTTDLKIEVHETASVGDPWNFGADPDLWIHTPCLWLTDTYPTPFFSDFKDAKKNYFLSYNLHAGIMSLIYCFRFQSAQHLYEKRKGSGSRSVPLWVFRIHDILVWLRIRIRRSLPLTNGPGFGSGCGSCYFRPWPSRRQQKTNLKKVFLLITFGRYT